MLHVQVVADFELDVLALAERAEEEEKQVEEERREEEFQDVLVAEEDVKTNYALVPYHLVNFPCNSCAKTFSSKNQLKHHHVEMHKDPMSCTTCYMTFSSKKMFLRHSSVHLPSTFTCETCGKAFTRGDSLRRHQVARHTATLPCSPAQCLDCGKKFSRKSSLGKHMVVVHGAGRPSQLLQDRYSARVRARRKITCATCYITFGTKYSFKDHMKKKHGGSQLLAPGPAGAEGGFAGEFMVVLDGRAMGDEDALPCKFCDMMFDSRKELMKHKTEKHRGERVHPCSICEKCFKSLPMLNQHKSRHHGGHVSVCEGCGKRFKTNDSLKRHKMLVCGKPRHRKNFNELSKWGKGHRVKTTAVEMITRLDGMEEEERRRTVLAIAKKRPEILNHMTKCPFTITDICQVKSVLVFWFMLYVIIFWLILLLPVFLVLNFFL